MPVRGALNGTSLLIGRLVSMTCAISRMCISWCHCSYPSSRQVLPITSPSSMPQTSRSRRFAYWNRPWRSNT